MSEKHHKYTQYGFDGSYWEHKKDREMRAKKIVKDLFAKAEPQPVNPWEKKDQYEAAFGPLTHIIGVPGIGGHIEWHTGEYNTAEPETEVTWVGENGITWEFVDNGYYNEEGK